MTVPWQWARVARRVLAGIAILFGLATVAAGGRVLAGADPGYVVFRPLLIFNTTMGLVYLAAGLAAWRGWRRDHVAAGAILLLNLVVFGAIWYLRREGAAVAIDSVRAMALRTGVWLALFLGLLGLNRTRLAD